MARSLPRIVQHDFKMDRLTVSRIFLICLATALIVVAVVLRRKVRPILIEFFTATTSPINLAVFRVVVFWTLLQSCHHSRVVWFSQIPAVLRVAPLGLEWLPHYLPIDPRWATSACMLLRVFSFTAMIGLFSRISAVLAVVFGSYVLSIPEFFGEVEHGNHHLLWFSAILAASRSGDALSCDAILSAWRRADRGVTDPPAPCRNYALPLRFVWLLIGIIYFFPGFWKFWQSGFDWALSENLKFTMYERWLLLGGWVPPFRLDLHPLLYKLLAMVTIIFEVAFIWLIVFPRLRIFAVLGGLAFHQMSGAFMRIAFSTLQRCYVVFFDWDAIFRRIGSWLYSQRMYLVYDGHCRICRRTIASLRVLDLFGRVTYLNASDVEALKQHGLLWLNPEAIMGDIHAIVGTRSWAGFSAYRALMARIPAFWPALPFLYLRPIPDLANLIYRHVADSRSGDIPDISSRRIGIGGDGQRLDGGATGVVTVGVILLCGNLICGVGELESSWPFACYPTFARIAIPQITSLTMVVVRSTGEMVPLKERPLKRKLGAARFHALTHHIFQTRDPGELRTRLTAFWQLWQHDELTPQQADRIRFYRDTLLTSPERQNENPTRRELLFELKL